MKAKGITGDKIKMNLGLNKKESTSKICETNPLNSSRATYITPVQQSEGMYKQRKNSR